MIMYVCNLCVSIDVNGAQSWVCVFVSNTRVHVLKHVEMYR
jgi:hypothetical protein